MYFNNMMFFKLLVLLNYFLIGNCDLSCSLPNTGTVLFRNIDMHRMHCWGHEEMALVYTRRAVMELVPKQIPYNVSLILEFMQICVSTLKEKTTSKLVFDYMFAALVDTFGGYLQTYGFPLVHEAYYEGYTTYANVVAFHRLQESFKTVLMTNGAGWKRPMDLSKHMYKVKPIKLSTLVPRTNSCSLLFLAVKTDGDKSFSTINQSQSIIPLPFLDDDKEPFSIAIPFQNRSLFNLRSRSSYDVLIKYYIESSRCIANNPLRQEAFNQVFLNWLKTKILPHLRDDPWYLGFSNVLRIEETLNLRIVDQNDEEEAEDKVDNSLFPFNNVESNKSQLSLLWEGIEPKIIVYLLISVILIMGLLLFICFLCVFILKKWFLSSARLDDKSNKANSSPDNSFLLSGMEDYSSRWSAQDYDTFNGFDTPSTNSVKDQDSYTSLRSSSRKGFRSRHRLKRFKK